MIRVRSGLSTLLFFSWFLVYHSPFYTRPPLPPQVYETGGGWGHSTSTDLITWTTLPNTPFDVATGSIAPTSGSSSSSSSIGNTWAAFYPNTSVSFPCCDIDLATSTAANQTDWALHGTVIPRPSDLSLHQGFRDPHRPLQIGDAWYMGVGSGSGADGTSPLAGRIRWFRSTNGEAMTEWTDEGIFFQVNETHGYTDPATMVWNATYVIDGCGTVLTCRIANSYTTNGHRNACLWDRGVWGPSTQGHHLRF